MWCSFLVDFSLPIFVNELKVEKRPEKGTGAIKSHCHINYTILCIRSKSSSKSIYVKKMLEFFFVCKLLNKSFNRSNTWDTAMWLSRMSIQRKCLVLKRVQLINNHMNIWKIVIRRLEFARTHERWMWVRTLSMRGNHEVPRIFITTTSCYELTTSSHSWFTVPHKFPKPMRALSFSLVFCCCLCWFSFTLFEAFYSTNVCMCVWMCEWMNECARWRVHRYKMRKVTHFPMTYEAWSMKHALHL